MWPPPPKENPNLNILALALPRPGSGTFRTQRPLLTFCSHSTWSGSPPPITVHHSLQIENLTWWTLAPGLTSGAKAGMRLSSAPLPSAADWEAAGPNDAPPASPSPGDGQTPTKYAFWARVCGLQAILLMCVNVFFYAYFA